jgi:hypothetical protein
MKTLSTSLIVGLFAILTSCQPILFRMAGIRAPKAESKVTIHEFLKKINVDTADVYTLDTSLFKEFRKLSFKPGWKPGFRPIQIRCYDSSGAPVMQWASCEGFLKDLKVFDSIPPKNYNGLDTSLTLSDDLEQYFTLNGIPAQIRPEKGYDYYFLVFFAKYFPRMTRESFSQLSHYILKYPELRMKVYKINVDVQEFWGEEVGINLEIH